MTYNYTLEGNWKDSDKQILLSAIETIAQTLSRVTGLDPEDIYNRVFGDLAFGLSSSLRYFGYVDKDNKNKITFRPNKLSKALIIHEFGHLFALRNKEPMETLLKKENAIYTPSGTFLTGVHIYGYYYRNNGRTAPKNGYKSDWYTDGFQIHPVTMKGGNVAEEDWADLFLNWVQISFVANEAGKTLYDWVENHMKLWLKNYIKEQKEQ